MTNYQGFEILAHRFWDNSISWKSSPTQSDAWGYLIYRSPSDGDIYGVVGAVSGTDRARAVDYSVPMVLNTQLNNAPEALLEQFAMACGLSITARAGLELGDGLVVAGMNSLALEVLAAGRAQGANTLCLITHADNTEIQVFQCLADTVLAFDNMATFDEQLTTFMASVIGKVVFVDTSGDVALIHTMTAHLERFGYLLLCRPDITTSAMLNIRDFQHRRSAVFDYWAGAATPEDAVALQHHFECAGRLICWRQEMLKPFNEQAPVMAREGV